MSYYHSILFILIASAISASECTQPILSIDGITYEKAIIKYTSGFTATIEHSNGLKSITIDKLPKDIQEKLNISTQLIDKEKPLYEQQKELEAKQKKQAWEEAKKAQKQAVQKQKEKAALLARAQTITISVYGHTNDAVLAYYSEPYYVDFRSPASSLGRVGGGGAGRSVTVTRYNDDKSIIYKIIGVKNHQNMKKGRHYTILAVPRGTAILDGENVNVFLFLKEKKD